MHTFLPNTIILLYTCLYLFNEISDCYIIITYPIKVVINIPVSFMYMHIMKIVSYI